MLRSLPIVLAMVLKVGDGGRVHVAGKSTWCLPPLCGSRVLFNVECPGCGLTRSLVLLAHGRWRESWAAHRLGWLLGLVLVAQVPYRLTALRSTHLFPLGLVVPRIVGLGVVAALVGNWLAKLLGA